jgi:hypothetical protein
MPGSSPVTAAAALRLNWGSIMEAAAAPNSIVSILLVGDPDDDLPRAMADALAAGGARIERFDDVYAAFVRLSADQGREIRMLLIDTRTADRAESRVFDVVRRYFPWVVAAAMRTDSASEDRTDHAALTVGEAVARLSSIVHGHAAPEPPRPANSDEPAADLKLHDAVRLRMSGEAGPAPARRPPPRTPPAPLPADLEDEILGPDDRARITPIELEALLRPTDDEREQGAA